MRFFIALVVAALTTACAASAQSLLERPAPLEKLKPGETRFLQALMAAQGTYDGLLDGDWGGRSLAAFRATTERELGTGQATIGDLAQLAAPFQNALAGGRWAPYYDETANMSLQMPMSVMQRYPGQDVAFIASDSTVLVRVKLGSPEEARQMHEAVENDALNPDQILRIRRPDLAVTSARMRDGVNSVYVRTQDRGQLVATTLVQWRPARASQARIMIASIKNGKQRALELPEGGLINRAIKAAQEVPQTDVATPDPQQGGDVETAKQSGAFAGTAFYINHGDLVTSAWVLEVCNKGLRLQDGTQLSALDIARPLAWW